VNYYFFCGELSVSFPTQHERQQMRILISIFLAGLFRRCVPRLKHSEDFDSTSGTNNERSTPSRISLTKVDISFRSEVVTNMSEYGNMWNNNPESGGDEYYRESHHLDEFEIKEFYRNPDSVETDSDQEYLLSTTTDDVLVHQLSSSGGVGFDFDEEEGQSVGF